MKNKNFVLEFLKHWMCGFEALQVMIMIFISSFLLGALLFGLVANGIHYLVISFAIITIPYMIGYAFKDDKKNKK